MPDIFNINLNKFSSTTCCCCCWCCSRCFRFHTDFFSFYSGCSIEYAMMIWMPYHATFIGAHKRQRRKRKKKRRWEALRIHESGALSTEKEWMIIRGCVCVYLRKKSDIQQAKVFVKRKRPNEMLHAISLLYDTPKLFCPSLHFPFD